MASSTGDLTRAHRHPAQLLTALPQVLGGILSLALFASGCGREEVPRPEPQVPVEQAVILDSFVANRCPAGRPCGIEACGEEPAGLVDLWLADGNGADSIGQRTLTVPPSLAYADGHASRPGNRAFLSTDAGSAPHGFLDGYSAFTIEGWFKPTKDLSPGSITTPLALLAKGDRTLNVGLDGKLEVALPQQTLVGTRQTWRSDTWYHLALSFDGATYRLYVDGNIDASAPSSQSLLSSTAEFSVIGSGVLIDELAVFSRALSGDEVKARHGSRAPLCGRNSCAPSWAPGSACYNGIDGIGVCDAARCVGTLGKRTLPFTEVDPFRSELPTSQVWVHGINNKGVVVGEAGKPTSAGDLYVGFTRSPDGTVTPLRDDTRGWLMLGYGINDANQVVGSAVVSLGGIFDLARVETDGTYGRSMRGYGYAINRDGALAGSHVFGDTNHAARTNAQLIPEDITGIDSPNSFATGIADDGTVVGTRYLPGRTPHFFFDERHPFIAATGAAARDLNDLLPANSGWELTVANAISANARYVVGTGYKEGAVRAYRLDLTTSKIINIDGINQGGNSYATAVNNRGDLVGVAYVYGDGTGFTHAFLYTDDLGFIDLNDTLTTDSKWNLLRADGINENRQIAGSGSLGGDYRGYVVDLSVLASICRSDDDCNDRDPCTFDMCTGGRTCSHTNRSVGSSCSADGTLICDDLAQCARTVVRPFLTCTIALEDGNKKAVFGYTNPGADAQNVHVPANTQDNNVVGATAIDNQPSWILAGYHPAAFVATYASNATWTLLGKTATSIGFEAPACVTIRTEFGEGIQLPDGNGETRIETLTLDPGAVAGPVSAAGDGQGATTGVATGTDVTVNRFGAAEFKIPINTPKGRRGIQPNLSLVYAGSERAPGLLGVGWQLQGLSKISRCLKTIAQDGAAGAIRFQDDDAFCLDGERLIPVRAGALEFRLEKHPFTKVIASQTTLDDILHTPPPDKLPQPKTITSFTVRTPDGLIRTYGAVTGPASKRANRANFDVEGPPTAENGNPAEIPDFSETVSVDWPLTSLQDRFSNQMTVQYGVSTGSAKDWFAFERWPVSVEYTANLPAGLTALRKVKFVYDRDLTAETPSLQQEERYVGGVRNTWTRLLRRIEIWAPNPVNTALTRYYDINYLASTSTKRPLLTSITECDAASVCKPASTFDYTKGDPDFEAHPIPGLAEHSYFIQQFGNSGNESAFTIADLNADGRDDLIIRNHAGVHPIYQYVLSKGDGFEDIAFFKNSLDDIYFLPFVFDHPVFADVNADGKPDWGTDNVKDGKVYFFNFDVALGTVQRVAVNGELVSVPFQWDAGRFQVGFTDFNGDGLVDVIQGDNLSLRYNTTTGLLPLEGAPKLVTNQPVSDVVYTELDGDRVLDVLVAPYEGLYWRPLRANGLQPPVNYLDAGRSPQLDVNGDGLPDQLLALFDRGVRINSGNGFLPPRVLVSPLEFPVDVPNYADPGVRVIDYDGDGKSDLLLVGQEARFNALEHPQLRKNVVLIEPNGGGKPSVKDLPIPTGLHSGDYEVAGSTCGLICENLRISPLTYGSTVYCQTVGSTGHIDPHCIEHEGGGVSEHGAAASLLLDANGDGLQDLLQFEGKPENEGRDAVAVLRLRKGQPPDLLRKVADGRSAETRVSYAPLTDTTRTTPQHPLYTKGTNCSYPQTCVAGGMFVVSEIKRDNGYDEPNWQQAYISYTDGRRDSLGAGFLGFSSVTSRTQRMDAVGTTVQERVTQYRSMQLADKVYPFLGLVARISDAVVNTDKDGHVKSHLSVSTYNDEAVSGQVRGTWEVRRFGTVVARYEGVAANPSPTNMTLLGREQSQLIYGAGFGRVSREERHVYDGKFKELESDFTVVKSFGEVKEDTWLVGKPELVEFTSTANGRTAARQVKFSYDPNTYALTGELIEPGGSRDDTLSRTYELDPAGTGIVVGITEDAAVGDSRKTSFAYDRNERLYVAERINPLGMVEKFVTHPAVDAVVLAIDWNGVPTKYVYDVFGRLLKIDRPDGAADEIRTYLANPLRISKSREGGGAVTSFYDRLGRVTRIETPRIGKRLAWTGVQYDMFGRVEREYAWRYGLDAGKDTDFAYDELDRLTGVNGTNEKNVATTLLSTSYDGFESVTTDADGVRTKSLRDARGPVVRSERSFQYEGSVRTIVSTVDRGPFGLIDESRVTTASNATLLRRKYTYDARGRLKDVLGPDERFEQWTYNGFGDVVGSTFGTVSSSSFEVDALGRTTKRVSEDGETTFSWDVAARGLGALASAASPDGVRSAYSYDYLGRYQGETVTMPWRSFTLGVTYDLYGRVAGFTYPETPGAADLSVRYSYDYMSGEMNAISRTDDLSQFWTLRTTFADGHAASETYGFLTRDTQADPRTGRDTEISVASGDDEVANWKFTYFDSGRLKSEGAALRGVDGRVEKTMRRFEYDGAGRLQTWTSIDEGGQEQWRVSYTFDDLGRFQKRSLSGTAVSDQTFSVASDSAQVSESARPTSVSVSEQGKVVNLGSLAYDDAGRITSQPLAGTIKWSSYDLPRQVSSAGQTTMFGYDAFGRRAWKRSPDGSLTSYLGNIYELRTVGGVDTHIMRAGPAQIVRDSSGDTALYAHRDRLGTPALVTSAGGVTRESRYYDPFGNRIASATDPRLVLVPRGGSSSSAIRDGFTGHEEDFETGIVNAGARIYDPRLHQFLSSDPLLGNLEDPVTLSPHAYVGNDPVNFIDPDGLVQRDLSGTPTVRETSGTTEPPQDPPPECSESGKECQWDGENDQWVRGDEGFGEVTVTYSVGYVGGSGGGIGVGGGTKSRTLKLNESITPIAIPFLTPIQMIPTLSQLAANAMRLLGTGAGAVFLLLALEGQTAPPELDQLHPIGGLEISLRPDVTLSGGRSGEKVPTLVGPADSAVRGSEGRVYVTDSKGRVIKDITGERVKPVTPGQGFGDKRPPTQEEKDLVDKMWGK